MPLYLCHCIERPSLCPSCYFLSSSAGEESAAILSTPPAVTATAPAAAAAASAGGALSSQDLAAAMAGIMAAFPTVSLFVLPFLLCDLWLAQAGGWCCTFAALCLWSLSSCSTSPLHDAVPSPLLPTVRPWQRRPVVPLTAVVTGAEVTLAKATRVEPSCVYCLLFPTRSTTALR